MNPQLKQKISALFTICMNANLNFNYSPKHGLIKVMEFDDDSEYLFNAVCLLEDVPLLTIKVKNYINQRNAKAELKLALEAEKAGLTN